MIYYETIHPEQMVGPLLDHYLALGWYRIGQTFITTDLITQEKKLIPVFWLRIDLTRYRPSGSARRIIAENAGYQTVIKPFAITDEIETLYAIYRASVNFTLPVSAHAYLLDGRAHNAYETRLIEIRDNGRLIAAGYFDLGAKTTTGILHIYHPDYAKQSSGKYLLLAELDYSRERNFEYYYPGYLSTEITKFNYKLFADRNATEVFLRQTRQWYPYNRMEEKLARWGRKITDAANRIYRLV